MKNRTIGKVQLVIGTILLLVGIIGLVYTISITDNLTEIVSADYRDSNYSLAEKTTIRYSATNLFATVYTSLALTSILTLFISLLFITEGMSKMSKE
ncbi:MAG: hypothetical protein ACP5NZ_02160 [Nanobdellota archaeon]